MRLVALLLLALAACGPDDCERAYAKLAPLLESPLHKPLTPAQIDSHVELCRADYVRHNGNAVMSCVLAAPDDTAIAACFDKLPSSISGFRLPFVQPRDAGF